MIKFNLWSINHFLMNDPTTLTTIWTLATQQLQHSALSHVAAINHSYTGKCEHTPLTYLSSLFCLQSTILATHVHICMWQASFFRQCGVFVVATSFNNASAYLHNRHATNATICVFWLSVGWLAVVGMLHKHANWFSIHLFIFFFFCCIFSLM